MLAAEDHVTHYRDGKEEGPHEVTAYRLTADFRRLTDHRIPPFRFERVRPKGDERPAAGESKEDMLPESIELVLSIENAVQAKCSDNAERQT